MNEKLFEIIRTTVNGIESELKRSDNTGIYFSPELHVAFCIGRDVSKNRKQIFGENEVQWLRETNIGNGGPSDILFKDGDRYIVIELKLRGTYDSYKADIEKLKRLDAKHQRFFCVLLDSFSEQNDERLIKLENEYINQITRIGHASFPTWNNWYQRQIYCNLNLYEVV